MSVFLVRACLDAVQIGVPVYIFASTLSKLSNYRILGKYPSSMKEKVQAIQAAISEELYNLMTNRYSSDEVAEMATRLNIEVISDSVNFVMAMQNHPNYVLKSTSRDFWNETSIFRNSMFWGLSYNATNREGGVCPYFFGLVERVAFSQRLRHIIKKYQLTMIKVPKKVLVPFPQHLVSSGALPLHNKRVFALSKRYKIDFNAPMLLNESEQAIFVKQLKIFFERAKGLLDIHDKNFCFYGKKLLFFDTEKFHLDPFFSKLCISAQHKETRISFENMRIYFNRLPVGRGANLASLCVKEIDEIKQKEKVLLISRMSISLIFMTLAFVSLQYLMLSFGAKISR